MICFNNNLFKIICFKESFFIVKPNQYGSHVVTSYSHWSVSSQEVIQQVLHNVSILLFGFYLLTYDIYKVLTVVDIPLPYTVTAQDNIFVRIMALHHFNVRFAGDHLLCVRKVPVFFVSKIPKWTCQVQSAIHSAHLNVTASFSYSGLLYLALRLVIQW